ncbi:MAG: endo-1,4-beta-xylanase [Bryobacterales bacterium]|nr:endo-1,4-beta-xylanase [Bryobacterales bacterium]
MFWLAFLTASLAAQTSIFPSDPLSSFRLTCTAGGAMVRVPVDGQPFLEALRITTPGTISTGTDREWSCRIRHTLAVSLKQNDWLVAVFHVRSLEAGPEGAAAKLSFERNSPDYRKSVSAGNLVTSTWRRVQVPFRVVEDYRPGEAMIDFWVGYDPQVIEIGGLQIDNHGPSPAPPVPTLGFTYIGREADAPWRAEAAARIDEHRKSSLVVRVVDAAGKPVPEAGVQVRMQRHAFGFGTAVTAAGLLGTTRDDEIYRARFLELFNKAVLENDLKWPGWQANPQRALDALAWLRARDIPARGHNMVWPNWQYLPADLRTLATDAGALRARIDQHILDVGSRTRGQVVDWDVVNEPIPNRVLQEVLGDDELVRWFQLARSVDPDVRLFINEYDIETGGGLNRRKQDQFYALIEDLLAKGAPVTGIGIQGHFGSNVTTPPRVYEILDRFARLNLPIQITEFDITTLDEQLQADYTRDYLTICFSHPALNSFLMWGFWEGRHWRPEAALFRRDWSEKPNAGAWRDLIYREWWTNADGVTSEEGAFEVRGFLGDYEVTVEAGGRQFQQNYRLEKDSAPLVFTLP